MAPLTFVLNEDMNEEDIKDDIKRRQQTKTFLYKKLNMSEIRNETNYPIATQIDRGLFEIYNSPIYQRLYKANKFNYNIRKCD